MEKSRNYALDFLKCIATMMVLNSHMSVCYPNFEYLATGGAIGNCLFFCVSGFLLIPAVGGGESFVDWYKRRIRRIIPTLITMGIVATIVFSRSQELIDVLVGKRYWFVQCILIYYVFAYLIRRWFYNSLHWVFLIVLGAIIGLYVWYMATHEVNTFTIYTGGYEALKWEIYFLFFLFGAMLNRLSLGKSRWWDVVGLVVCIGAWYGCMAWCGPTKYQLFTIIPMFGILYFAYRVGDLASVKRVFASAGIGKLLLIIGNLCLDCYLIQFDIITDRFNVIFPLNVPLIWCLTLLAAYGLNILSKLIASLLDSKPFDWKHLFRIV